MGVLIYPLFLFLPLSLQVTMLVTVLPVALIYLRVLRLR